jgi:hydroxymethylbilane synthase
VEVTTRGDVDPGSLASIGGAGVFVAAVRRAVLEGRADLAVHSLKDLPTTPEPGISLAAVPRRGDARDVLVSRHDRRLADLPPGARVGTGSPRRRAQLEVLRPDLQVVDIRGNVDTRMARTHHGGDLDAVVLAAAGLARLGRLAEACEHLPTDVMTPAPGQGALGVEARDDHSDEALAEALRGLDDAATRAAVVAERALLATVAAGCAAPVGAHAWLGQGSPAAAGTDARRLHMLAVMARPEGSLARASANGPVDRAEDLGRGLALDLIDPRIDQPRGSARA